MEPLFQDTQGLELNWTETDRSYRVQMDPATLNISAFSFWAFRIGQSAEPNNPVNQDQDLTITFSDGHSNVSIITSLINRLLYPSEGTGVTRMVMQTLRIPLSQLTASGLNLTQLETITFSFNQTGAGTLYLDDLQLTK